MMPLRLFAVVWLTLFAASHALAKEQKELVHVVLFKMKADTTKDDLTKLGQGIVGLKDKISLVQSLKWGPYTGDQSLNKGFTHAAIFTFKTQEDLMSYSGSAPHKEFLSFAKPRVEEFLVFDFWTGK